MNISEVSLSLSAGDIKTIINEFVKVEGLTIETIDFENESLRVTGVFRKFLSIGFSATVDIVEVNNNILKVKFSKASLMKIGVLSVFRKIALKIALKGFKESGITINKDEIDISISSILKDVKLINLTLKEAEVSDSMLKVKVEEISLTLPELGKKPIIKVQEEVEREEESEESTVVEETNLALIEDKKEENSEDEDYTFNINIEKKDDAYSHGREAVIRTIPEGAKPYSDIILFVPDLVALVVRLLKDKRVPIKTRITLGASLGYTIIPFDIIPDKVPVLGEIDDIAVILFALERIVSDVDTEVILENWQGRDELVIVLKEVIEYLSGFTGAKNLNKIYNIIDSLT